MDRVKLNLRKVVSFLPLLIILVAPLTLASVFAGVPPLLEVKAYQQFRLRPVSEFSKLIYLIDRFSELNIEIVYDGHYYKAPFVARLARWFLARNYKKEPASDWIMRWCNSSVPAGNLIWVKFTDGKFRLSREILFEELKSLDEAIAADEFFRSKSSNLTNMAQRVGTPDKIAQDLPRSGDASPGRI